MPTHSSSRNTCIRWVCNPLPRTLGFQTKAYYSCMEACETPIFCPGVEHKHTIVPNTMGCHVCAFSAVSYTAILSCGAVYFAKVLQMSDNFDRLASFLKILAFETGALNNGVIYFAYIYRSRLSKKASAWNHKMDFWISGSNAIYARAKSHEFHCD